MQSSSSLWFNSQQDPETRRVFIERELYRYKDMTMDHLLRGLPDAEPHRYLYDLVPLYPRRSGKGLRPALCLASCGAFGGSPYRAIPSASSIELFHNAFLIHDDIEDGSDNRRGEPTLNAQHGSALAINVGDALNVLSIRPLMTNLAWLGPTLTWRIFTEIEHMVRQTVEGQAVELGWVHDNICDLREKDYLQMILKKTCWYTCIEPCRIGALIATRGKVDPERFNRFGYYMGAAFQIQDDILNLVGDAAKYGKEIGGDIWEGKRTLMLIHALNHGTKREKREMIQFLGKPRSERSRDEITWVYEVMARYDSIGHARSCARQLTGAAYREFHVAYGDQLESECKRFIENLIFYMVERDL